MSECVNEWTATTVKPWVWFGCGGGRGTRRESLGKGDGRRDQGIRFYLYPAACPFLPAISLPTCLTTYLPCRVYKTTSRHRRTPTRETRSRWARQRSCPCVHAMVWHPWRQGRRGQHECWIDSWGQVPTAGSPRGMTTSSNPMGRQRICTSGRTGQQAWAMGTSGAVPGSSYF